MNLGSFINVVVEVISNVLLMCVTLKNNILMFL